MVLTKKEILVFLGIVILFFALRLPGLDIPYHQDEYKWPLYSEAVVFEPGSVPHTPLTEFIYVQGGRLIGLDNFRYIPLVFSIINFFLLFYLVRLVADKKSALWSSFLFSISFFSILASLMIDVDGAVMPMFFLIMSIGYMKLRAKSFGLREGNWKWFICLILGAIGGFLVKVVFVLPIATFALDYAIEKQIFSDKKKLLKYVFYTIFTLMFFILILFGLKYIFPFFNLSKAVTYWQHFAVWGDRGWMQTFIQFAKALLYTSPLLLLPPLFIDREIFQKSRPFFLYVCFGLFFYLFAFDFSLGALDRYFQFLVVPFCVICGVVFGRFFSFNNSPPLASLGPSLTLRDGTVIGVIALVTFSLQFFDHFVPPHYPKSEWLDRIINLKWDFLFPFSGGSGPTGFYISFAFIGLIWICSLISLIFALKEKSIKKNLLMVIFIFGIVYNGVFVEEYLFGKINGSPYTLFNDAKGFIYRSEDIKKVVVYNDIGGFEIRQLGKYARRMYAAPQFEETYKEFFKNFSGHILYINIPKVGDNSFYANYMMSCKNIYKEIDLYITAEIFDCKK